MPATWCSTGRLAAYEGQVLAEAAGVELAKLAQVVRASDAQSGAATLMFRPTVAPFSEADDRGLVGAMQAAAALAHKDVQAVLALAGELEIELPLAAMTEARSATKSSASGCRRLRQLSRPGERRAWIGRSSHQT